MRKLIASTLLASLALGALGCGEEAPPPASEAERAKLPGAPTEGPEAPKAVKSKKR